MARILLTPNTFSSLLWVCLFPDLALKQKWLSHLGLLMKGKRANLGIIGCPSGTDQFKQWAQIHFQLEWTTTGFIDNNYLLIIVAFTNNYCFQGHRHSSELSRSQRKWQAVSSQRHGKTELLKTHLKLNPDGKDAYERCSTSCVTREMQSKTTTE